MELKWNSGRHSCTHCVLTAKVDRVPERQARNGNPRSVERALAPVFIEPKYRSVDLELGTTRQEDSLEYHQIPTGDPRSNTTGDVKEPVGYGGPSLIKSGPMEQGANIKSHFGRRQIKELPGIQSVVVGHPQMKKRPGRNGESSHERCRKARKGHDVSSIQ